MAASFGPGFIKLCCVAFSNVAPKMCILKCLRKLLPLEFENARKGKCIVLYGYLTPFKLCEVKPVRDKRVGWGLIALVCGRV